MKKIDLYKMLGEFWNIPPRTLQSRERSKPKEFEAFVLGTECIKKGLDVQDLEFLEKIKKG